MGGQVEEVADVQALAGNGLKPISSRKNHLLKQWEEDCSHHPTAEQRSFNALYAFCPPLAGMRML